LKYPIAGPRLMNVWGNF